MTTPTSTTLPDPPPTEPPTTPAQQRHIETIFRTSYASLYAYAMCIGAPSREDAEDAVQHAFCNVLAGHRCLSAPEASNEVVKYLYTTVDGLIRNLWRDTTRDQRHRHQNTSAVQASVGPSVLPTPDATVMEAELDERLCKAITALPPQQQRILLLTRQGYTYTQVAALLNISTSTVNNHIVRALHRLRRELRDWLPENAAGADAQQEDT